MWTFLTSEWRSQWHAQVSLLYPNNDFTVDGAVVVDCTPLARQAQCINDIEMMKDTAWVNFVCAFEACNTVPQIRCPWGCSEYIGKTNSMPFDQVVSEFALKRIKTYTSSTKMQRHGFRKDWLLEPCEILHRWKVYPSIEMVGGDPMILLCRYHNSGHLGRYIHPPRNPTGSIGLRGDHSLAQIMAVPRSVGTFKRKKSTNSYRLLKVLGNYSGIDSLNVTTRRQQIPSNFITDVRDECVRIGRYDYLDETENRMSPMDDEEEPVGPVHHQSGAPAELCSQLKRNFGQGATFVPFHDIIHLQDELKEGDIREITVHRSNDAGNPVSQVTTYIPPWGNTRIHVISYQDAFGDCLPCFMGFSKHILHEWQHAFFWFANIIHMIPEVWHLVDKSVTENSQWQGWMLYMLAQDVLKLKRRTRVGNKHPFYLKTGKKQLLSHVLQILNLPKTQSRIVYQLHHLFTCTLGGSIEGIYVTSPAYIPTAADLESKSVVIVIFDMDAPAFHLSPASNIKDFSLRAIGTHDVDSNMVNLCIRQKHHNNFWVYSRDNFTVSFETNPWDCADELVKRSCVNWTFCVFVRETSPDYAETKEHLMTLLGAEYQVRCARHSYPLIPLPCQKVEETSGKVLYQPPICCQPPCYAMGVLGCSADGCCVSLCRSCLRKIKAEHGEDQGDYYVGYSLHQLGAESDDESDEVSWTETNGNEDISEHDAMLDSMNDSSSDSSFDDVLSFDDENNSQSNEESDGDSLISLIQYAYDASDGEIDSDDDDSSMSVSNHSDDMIMEGDDDADDDSFVMDADLFQSTPAMDQTLKFDVTKLLAQGSMIPNHIILNCHGSLLLRRHKKLTPTNAAKNFLMKLVASSKGKNIPLLHPEGSMFPSLFWLANDDGAIVGSLPSCLLMDDYTLDGLNVASLYDHCRTRLLDPSLLSSTDTKYWGQMWDVCANLGLRGTNAKLILQRGWSPFIQKEGLRINTDDPRVYDSHQLDSRKTVNQLAAAGARKKNDLFFTWTMNGTKTPGVRLITEWLRTDELVDIVINSAKGLNLGKHLDSDPDRYDRTSISRQLEEAGGVYVTRAWLEFITAFLYYLQYGKDSPFLVEGLEIENIWNRAEIQSDQDGKAPHCHTLIYFKNDTSDPEERCKVLHLIRACLNSFINADEISEMVDKGMLPTAEWSTKANYLNEVQEKQTHHCTSRCTVETQIRNEDGTVQILKERKCKAPDHRRLNPAAMEGQFIPIRICHDQLALQAMIDMELLADTTVPNDDTALAFEPLPAYKHLLVAERYCPPCSSIDGIFSPGNPFLFVMLWCAMNIQFVTLYILARYLAKYCASIDKSNKLNISMNHKQKHDASIVHQQGHNTKIAGNKFSAAITDAAKTKKDFSIEGRTLSMAEIVMQFLQYPAITTSFRFEFIPTTPMGSRPALAKRKSALESMQDHGEFEDVHQIRDLDEKNMNAGYVVRRSLQLGTGRQFTPYQLTVYADFLFQEVHPDKVTKFSLRPPELRFIRRLPHYFIYFERVPLPNWPTADTSEQEAKLRKILKKQFLQCPWIDGLGNKILVRRPAIPKILTLLETYPQEHIVEDFGSTRQHLLMKGLFRNLAEWNGDLTDSTNSRNLRSAIPTTHRASQQEKLAATFVSMDERPDLPVYWFRTVRSTEAEHFLYHMLLSMGHFTTELELYCQGSLKEAFVSARLLPRAALHDQDCMKASIKALAREYVIKQLCYYPVGTMTFDREITTIYSTLCDYFIHDVLESKSMPSVLFTQLHEQCSESLKATLFQNRKHLCQSFCSSLRPTFQDFLPDSDQILNATLAQPLPFDIENVPQSPQQSDESFAEHQAGYSHVKTAVQHYLQASTRRTKSIAFVGGGGVGKTVDLRMAGLYALSQGLSVMSTTLTGKRGAETAGEHIHVRFHIPVNENLSVVEAAERAYVALLNDPLKLIQLSQLDVLLIDELGQIDCRLLAIIDHIMRRIRHSTHWMGGVLVFATMDEKQLKPINGFPPLFSPALMCSFVFVPIQTPLRTLDAVLQEIQKITRMTTKELLKNPETKKCFFNLVGNHCKFFETFDDPEIQKLSDAVYCFPHHDTCAYAERKVLSIMQHRFPDAVTKHAIDYQETRTQIAPTSATESTSKTLDRKARASRKLVFYPNCPFEITYNDKKGRFFHGQLCIMPHDYMPSQSDLDNWRPITLLRAPHGVDTPPSPDLSEQDLLQLGWERISIGREPKLKKHKIRKQALLGFREQYGLKHRIAVTIHAIMGATVTKLITQIDGRHNRSLWEAAMVVVLLSRTRFASDIYFVGDKQATLETLWSALTMGGRFAELSDHIMKALLGKHDHEPLSNPYETAIDLQALQHLQPLSTTVLPTYGEHVAYMIASVHQVNSTYVGHTKCIRKRLNAHNSYGGGSRGTGGHHRALAPWGLFAMVVGFDDKHDAASFEGHWKLSIATQQSRSGGRLSVTQKAAIAQQIINSHHFSQMQNLRLVLCAKISNET